MSTQNYTDNVYDGINFSINPLSTGDYEGCSFVNCDLSNIDLSNIKFIDTEFRECNLSNSRIASTAFQEVVFNQCKMLGLRFDESNNFAFAVRFENCQLSHSSFYKMKLVRTSFIDCLLREVDFEGTELKGRMILNCDLLNARFESTNLEKANMRGSFNYSLSPESNRIKGAIFSKESVLGLLDKYQIIVD